MKKNLPAVRQDSKVILAKSKSIVNITNKILKNKLTQDDDIWMQRLWDWADAVGIDNLEWVEVHGTSGQGFPRSREMLLNLTTLKINVNYQDCLDDDNYIRIPEEIGNLKNLTELDIFYVHELPTTISNLKSLTSLSLGGISSLPNYVGQFTNLKELTIFDVHVVPDCIW